MKKMVVMLVAGLAAVWTAFAETVSVHSEIDGQTPTLGAPYVYGLVVDAASGVKSVRVKGLPPGFKFDKKTMAIVGAPSKPGVYHPLVTVVAKSGAKGQATFTVEVPALPHLAVGQFAGGILFGERIGMLLMKITANGRVSGKVTFGDRKTLAVKSGRLNVSSGDATTLDLVFRDGSVRTLKLDQFDFGDIAVGQFTDAATGADGAGLTQDLFVRADTKAELGRMLRTAIADKNESRTVKISKKGVVKHTGYADGRKFSTTTYLQPWFVEEDWFVFTFTVPYPDGVSFETFEFDLNPTLRQYWVGIAE